MSKGRPAKTPEQQELDRQLSNLVIGKEATVKSVTALLEAGDDNHGSKLLIQAINKKLYDIAEFLINQGAKTDVREIIRHEDGTPEGRLEYGKNAEELISEHKEFATLLFRKEIEKFRAKLKDPISPTNTEESFLNVIANAKKWARVAEPSKEAEFAKSIGAYLRKEYKEAKGKELTKERSGIAGMLGFKANEKIHEGFQAIFDGIMVTPSATELGSASTAKVPQARVGVDGMFSNPLGDAGKEEIHRLRIDSVASSTSAGGSPPREHAEPDPERMKQSFAGFRASQAALARLGSTKTKAKDRAH